MNTINANEMTFGIEIECTMPRTHHQEIGGYHRGVQMVGLPTGWMATADSSIRARGYNRVGVEVVSPVLKGVEGMKQVMFVVKQLVEWGFKVNESCGFHVHVGFDDAWGIKGLRNVAMMAAAYERAFYAASGTKNRERGNWCAPVKALFNSIDWSRATMETNYAGTKKVARVNQNVSRYHAINLSNIFGEGRPNTVEVRAYAGTLNANKIIAYIRMAISLVHRAASSASRTWEMKGQNGRENVASFVKMFGWTDAKRTKFGGEEIEGVPSFNNSAATLMKMAEKYDAMA